MKGNLIDGVTLVTLVLFGAKNIFIFMSGNSVHVGLTLHRFRYFQDSTKIH